MASETLFNLAPALSPASSFPVVDQRALDISQTLRVLRCLLRALAPTVPSAQNPFLVLSAWQRPSHTSKHCLKIMVFKKTFSAPSSPKKQLHSTLRTFIYSFNKYSLSTSCAAKMNTSKTCPQPWSTHRTKWVCGQFGHTPKRYRSLLAGLASPCSPLIFTSAF